MKLQVYVVHDLFFQSKFRDIVAKGATVRRTIPRKLFDLIVGK